MFPHVLLRKMNLHFTMETSVSKGLFKTSTFLWFLGLSYRCSLNIHALQLQEKTLTIYLTLRTYLSTIICFGCSFSNTPDSEKAFCATQWPGQSPCTAKDIMCLRTWHCKLRLRLAPCVLVGHH